MEKDINVKQSKVLFVTTVKPMISPFITEQTNGILSWKKLRIDPRIIIFGNDQGAKEFCETHNIEHHPDIRTTKCGIPYLNDIIKKGYGEMDKSNSEYIMYINADILLLNDFSDTFEAFDKLCCEKKIEKCLLTADRFNIHKFELIDYNKSNWQEQLKTFIGKGYEDKGVDLFLHKKNNYIDLPDFIIGKLAFDNWMTDYAVKNFELCVNATNTIKVYHFYGYWWQNGKAVERKVELINKDLLNNNLSIHHNSNIKYNCADYLNTYSINNNGTIEFRRR
jgi:hypothetical protein